MEKLGIDAQLIVLQAINFAILLYVLNRFLYKPVLGMLAKRKEQIEHTEKVQKELEVKVKNLETDREAMLTETKIESQKILEDARTMSEKIGESVKADAKKRADDLLLKAKADIAREREQLKDSVKDEVAKVAVEVAQRVLEQTISDDQREKITSSAVDNFVNDAK
ncbi:ATP synthase F0 subunit B [candidate division WWE3 bacterium CG22_combo_CG10-13_8_21_14_all_39_12]|uniref:ATP synthase subunit b n=2 Tax=Katanobacteria TaxID=422282 RepID=A0A2M7X111_UNCKA|nr:MAG: ATP synthase F0 subunit B [candidate division WWE3 bacterium CG22_combo_CG10-13_8_21_14_all_39_12]PJA39769.1 MAG: ATP synthase F0 subunit B [candidate division WWE3 bacterium CG_4_9_14_3_um_filter_39_7]